LARNRVWCLAKNVPGPLWRRSAAAVLWYDTSALLGALARRDGAWLRGRRDGLRHLAAFRVDRQVIQRRMLVTSADLLAALGPRVGPLGAWRARQAAVRYSQRPVG
jgi:hypothetical protein